MRIRLECFYKETGRLVEAIDVTETLGLAGAAEILGVPEDELDFDYFLTDEQLAAVSAVAGIIPDTSTRDYYLADRADPPPGIRTTRLFLSGYDRENDDAIHPVESTDVTESLGFDRAIEILGAPFYAIPAGQELTTEQLAAIARITGVTPDNTRLEYYLSEQTHYDTD